ncbi:MAG: hypothetical protein PHO27_09075 [Sulfuricurvum sp.]|nr:hypothetical protein [Sulfuricurvum sp.]
MSVIDSWKSNTSLVSYGSTSNTKNDFSSISMGSDYQALWNQATSGLSIQQKTELFANTFDPNASATSDQNRLNNAAEKFRQLSSLSSGTDQTKFTSYANAISAFSNLLDDRSNISSQSITEAANQYDVTNMTTNEMNQMANNLFKSGAIDLDTLGTLTLMPAKIDMDSNGNITNITPLRDNSTHFNYLKNIEEGLSNAKSTGSSSTPYFQKVYDVLSMINQLHTSGSSRLDTVS